MIIERQLIAIAMAAAVFTGGAAQAAILDCRGTVERVMQKTSGVVAVGVKLTGDSTTRFYALCSLEQVSYAGIRPATCESIVRSAMTANAARMQLQISINTDYIPAGSEPVPTTCAAINGSVALDRGLNGNAAQTPLQQVVAWSPTS